MPKGLPGRKSFVAIPQVKKKFWRKEALDLRKILLVMMPIHFIFVLTDIYVFDFEISAMIFDGIYLWMSFYNYMTLNKIMVGV